jgi:hypothetical protein
MLPKSNIFISGELAICNISYTLYSSINILTFSFLAAFEPYPPALSTNRWMTVVSANHQKEDWILNPMPWMISRIKTYCVGE